MTDQNITGEVAAVAFGVALLCTLIPARVRADALPPDPNDIYYHCSASEQCSSGSKMCKANNMGAGRKEVDAACDQEAKSGGLTQRCLGKDGFLYCPGGPTPTNANATPASSPSATAPSTAPVERSSRGCTL